MTAIAPDDLERITNKGFLSHFFSDALPDEIFLCSLPGDPAAPEYGYPSWEKPVVEMPPDRNNFVCVSSLRREPTGRLRRVPDNFSALHLLVVDDVRQKTDAASIEGLLGRPSYILETSPGSEQWGYKLSPVVDDRATAHALIQALGRAVGIHDMAGVNRVCRLPVGINGKPKYGVPSPRCRLRYFDPDAQFDPEALVRKLCVVPDDYKVPSDEPFLPAHADPVVAALAEKGLDPTPMADPGKYAVTCPWVDEHTDGRDDGTAYLAPAGFHCFHGHCAERTFWDLREWLGLTVERIERARAEALFAEEETSSAEESDVSPTADLHPSPLGDETTAASSLEVSVEVGREPAETSSSSQTPAGEAVEPTYDFPCQQIADEWVGATFADLLTETGEVRWDQIPAREWLMHELIQLNAPWYVAGEGGVGKSRWGLAVCMAIASGKPFGGFVPDPAGHPVIFLSQEDDRIDRLWRFATQYERWVDQEGDWTAEELEKLRTNLLMPQLKWGQKADETVREVIRLVGQRLGEVRLVLWDPLILFWDEGSKGENNINTASGAIATFRGLIEASKADGAKWSAGMLHHLNREGETYGSAMLTAQARACFKMTLERQGPLGDQRNVTRIELIKVNSSPRLGWSEEYEMHPVNGSLWVADQRWFGTDAELVAALIRTGDVAWDQSQADVARAAARNSAISGTTPEHRAQAVKDVLREWSRLDEDELEDELENRFGLRRSSKGQRARFEPIEGWVVRGDDE